MDRPIRTSIIALVGLTAIGLSVPPAQAGPSFIEITPPNIPVELATGAGGVWYTSGNYTVGRVDPDLTIHEFPVTAHPIDIAAGPDGNMWVTEAIYDYYETNGLIGRVTPDGVVTEFTVPTEGSYPDGIAAGPDGNVWFTEYDGGKIGKITPDGAITEYPLSNQLFTPAGIAAGADGNMWFVESTYGYAGRITLDGVITLFPMPQKFTRLYNIALGPDGNMWVTEDDHVGRVTPDGQITQYSVTTNWYVWDIVSLRSSLVFTEPGTNEMGRVWPNGGLREVTIPKAIVVPWALAVSDGQLWITEQSQIAIITP